MIKTLPLRSSFTKPLFKKGMEDFLLKEKFFKSKQDEQKQKRILLTNTEDTPCKINRLFCKFWD